MSDLARNALDVPPNVHEGKEGGEVLRAWIVDSGLAVSLNPLAFDEPGIWGLLLVDIARHVARANEMEGVGSADAVLAEIREIIEAEFERPTDEGETGPHRPN